MTQAQLVTKLTEMAAKLGSKAALARSLGVTRQYIQDVLNGNRTAGDKLLAQLGLQKVKRSKISYERRKS